MTIPDSWPSRHELNVFGRKLVVHHASDNACGFTFSELCDEVKDFRVAYHSATTKYAFY